MYDEQNKQKINPCRSLNNNNNFNNYLSEFI